MIFDRLLRAAGLLAKPELTTLLAVTSKQRDRILLVRSEENDAFWTVPRVEEDGIPLEVARDYVTDELGLEVTDAEIVIWLGYAKPLVVVMVEAVPDIGTEDDPLEHIWCFKQPKAIDENAIRVLEYVDFP